MPNKEFNVAQAGYSIGQDRSFEAEIDLDAIGESKWYIVPEKLKFLSVSVSFTGGASGKMQTTTDRVDVVKNGTPVPIDWPFGTVDNNRIEVCWPPSAIRAVQETSGEMKITIRGQ